MNRLSANNCARIYNHTLASSIAYIENNSQAYTAQFDQVQSKLNGEYKLTMTSDQALHGFFLYSLIFHHAENKTSLVLPKATSNIREELNQALNTRNKFMKGTGQELWSHACYKCCIMDKDKDDNDSM